MFNAREFINNYPSHKLFNLHTWMDVTYANQYYLETLYWILSSSYVPRNPRTRWQDGSVASYNYITPKYFSYNLEHNEFPLNTLRPTALKGAFHDISAIYQKQTNIIEKMDHSVESWWKDFVVTNGPNDGRSIGQTYGHTIDRWDIMNKTLNTLVNDPFSRRIQMDMWQYQQMEEDPKALVPCCFLSMYNVTENPHTGVRYLNMTLVQRSQDFMMTAAINPIQYVMLGMMICSHLRYHTKSDWMMGEFNHMSHNPHIYDRHLESAAHILTQALTPEYEQLLQVQPTLHLPVAKDFYDITWEDFEVRNYPRKDIPKLPQQLEIAI